MEASWSGRKQRAAAKADANVEQQLKRIDAIARGAAAEADAIGEQQLQTESCPAPDYSCRRTPEGGSS